MSVCRSVGKPDSMESLLLFSIFDKNKKILSPYPSGMRKSKMKIISIKESCKIQYQISQDIRIATKSLNLEERETDLLKFTMIKVFSYLSEKSRLFTLLFEFFWSFSGNNSYRFNDIRLCMCNATVR